MRVLFRRGYLDCIFILLGISTDTYLRLHPAETQSADGLPLGAAEAEGLVLDPPGKVEAVVAPALKPALQLRLGPVAARNEEDAALLDKVQDAVPISLAQASTLGVLFIAETDGVEGALVQHDVPAIGLGPVEDGVEGPSDDVPLLELDGVGRIGVGLGVGFGLLGHGDLAREGDALRAVVDAQGASRPGFVAEGKEEGAVAAAEIEKGGVVARDGQVVDEQLEIAVGQAVEEVEDLGLSIGVVEPDGADVGGVCGVIGDFAGIEGIPAVCGGVSWLRWGGEMK